MASGKVTGSRREASAQSRPWKRVDVHLLAVLQHRLLTRDSQDHLAGAGDLSGGPRTLPGRNGWPPPRRNRVRWSCCARADSGARFISMSRAMALAAAAGLSVRPANWWLPMRPPPFKIYILCREADACGKPPAGCGATPRTGSSGRSTSRPMNWIRILSAYGPRASAAGLHLHGTVEDARGGRGIPARQRLARRAHPVRLLRGDGGADRRGGRHDRQRPGRPARLRSPDQHGPEPRWHGPGRAAFLSSPEKAAERYRVLGQQLRLANGHLREGTSLQSSVSEVRIRLLECALTVEEQLADCTLFGDASTRDLKEATDDLRRALRLCYLLPRHSRERIQAGLLYRQALVLGLRSEVQNLQLAHDYLGQAAQAVKLSRRPGPGPRGSCHPHAFDPRRALQGFSRVARRSRQGRVREEESGRWSSSAAALLRFRGNSAAECPCREHLELLMFAARVLVEESLSADRFHLLLGGFGIAPGFLPPGLG